MSRTIPTFATDEEAERFVDSADLSEHDLSGFKPVRFEFQSKGAQVNMRLPRAMLDAIKTEADRLGMPYQRFIRLAIERALATR